MVPNWAKVGTTGKEVVTPGITVPIELISAWFTKGPTPMAKTMVPD
jgi:hypothetical protein